MIRAIQVTRRRKTAFAAFHFALALAWILSATANGEPTTPESAERLVRNWLDADPCPLGARLAANVADVQTYFDRSGRPAYFLVNLNPSGFVVVSGDDLVEPIIAFTSAGSYDPSPANPLHALVSTDVPARVEAVRSFQARRGPRPLDSDSTNSEGFARAKWRKLLMGVSAANASAASDGAHPVSTNPPLNGIPGLSDPRVDPFVVSKWGQTTECGLACYNYYTPPGAAGSASNYPAGCVGIAMAQLMRYHQHPGSAVGTGSFQIKVCGVPEYRNLRGGDGAGGPYSWSEMVLDPDCSITLSQRQAIGALCHDAGVAVSTDYCYDGSGAYMDDVPAALKNTFAYSNAILYGSIGSIALDKLYRMINPNLHARHPVLLGIRRDGGGHAVVCDGYGYNDSTPYHHLNMGWNGLDDVWYNLPTIDTSVYTYTSVTRCVYNVYTTGSGEIIAGRVTDSTGNPLQAALVASGAYADTTDARGLYALAKVPSNTQFLIRVQKDGYLFSTQLVTTGLSNLGGGIGNTWPIDFVGYVPTHVGDAKKNADGVTVALQGVVVTAVFEDWFYVQSENRTGGILAYKSSHGVTRGQRVDLIGIMRTNSDGERFIEVSFIETTGQAEVVPVGMPLGTLGGANWYCIQGQSAGQLGVTGGWGLNNIGLLVRVWGRFTYIDSHNFTLDDGSDAVVHCVTPSDVTVSPTWDYAAVTGISSCERVGDELRRKLLVRSADDIRPILP